MTMPEFGEAVETLNRDGRGGVVLLCEHASSQIPDGLNNLGLSKIGLTSHAAWDPGARRLSIVLSKALDAPFVAATLSRLVYDCNRSPDDSTAMPERSEYIDVPGNISLSASDKAARVAGVYTPFCQAVDDILAYRQSIGMPTALVTIHSFTPVYFGQARQVEIGILHDDDPTFASAMLNTLSATSAREIRRNEPYGPDDGVTHSLRKHGIDNGLRNVMIEVRSDLLEDEDSTTKIATELLEMIESALDQTGSMNTEASPRV